MWAFWLIKDREAWAPTPESFQTEAKMDAEKIMQKAIKANPDIQLVLDIAARAREAEARTLPAELNPTTEVVALPTNPQCIV